MVNLVEQISSSFNSFNTISQLGNELVNRDPEKYSIHKYPLALVGVFGLPYWEGYYFHRYIDDLLDGDIKHDHPVDRVYTLREQVRTGDFSTDDNISDIAARYLDYTRKHNPFPDLDPEKECLRSIDGMLYDYFRGKERVLLTEESLEAYYTMTFDSVLTITEILLQTRIPSHVKQLLIAGQGKIYSIRDFDKDWEDGILNIPGETIDLAGLDQNSCVSDVRANSTIRQWVSETINDFRTTLNSQKVQGDLHSMQPGSISGARRLLI